MSELRLTRVRGVPLASEPRSRRFPVSVPTPVHRSRAQPERRRWLWRTATPATCLSSRLKWRQTSILPPTGRGFNLRLSALTTPKVQTHRNLESDAQGVVNASVKDKSTSRFRPQ